MKRWICVLGLLACSCGSPDQDYAARITNPTICAGPKKDPVVVIRNRRGQCWVIVGMTMDFKPVFKRVPCPGERASNPWRNWAGISMDVDDLPYGMLVIDPEPSIYHDYAPLDDLEDVWVVIPKRVI